jgi:aminoglycoside 3-N-acetyltransferase
MASVFPRGTLVMPTFNYDFPKTKEYDPKRAPSQVGTLTEFFRKQKGVSRSMHPVFSVASRGPKTRRLLKTALDGFGEHSFFANLRGEKGKIVFLGAPFQSCTFVHHIEQMKGVPYRFMKKFDGRVRTAHGKKKMEITFHVRPLDGSVITELARFEARLRKKKLLRGVRVGAGEILAISACDIFREGISMLKSDTRAFLAK